MDNRKEFILSMNLRKVMWQISWPAVAAIVLYGLNNFLDALLVGRLVGPQALAAVGLAYPLSQIVMGFGRLIGTGASAALSIWLGANDSEKLKQLFGNLNVLSIVCAALFAIPAYFFAENLLSLMGAKGELIPIATSYFRVTIIGSAFWIHGFSVNMLIRGEGKMKTAAWMIGAGLLIDIALKPIFIVVFNGGVAGAAWATNTAMFIYSAMGLIYFARNKSLFRDQWYSLKATHLVAKKIITLGFPEMLFSVMSVIQSMLILQAISRYGTQQDLLFYTIVNRFYLLLLTPLFGLMRGLQPVVGINFGARNFLRAQKSLFIAIAMGIIIVLPFWIIALFFPDILWSFMVPNVHLTAVNVQNLRIYLSILPFLPVIVMALAYFPAINQAKKASKLAILRQLFFYLPATLILPVFFGVNSIFWGSACIELLVIFITLLMLRASFIKDRSVLSLN
jgi:putative MATE family efflux protein